MQPAIRPSFCAAAAPALLLALLLAPLPAVSAVPTDQSAADRAALQQQIDTLQRTVKQLQQQLNELKARPAPAKSAPAPRAGGAHTPAGERAPGHAPAAGAGAVLTPQIKENWGALKHGMSMERVRALLGAPSRKLEIGGQPLWYYYYTGTGGGSVMFSRSGTVSSWQHPPFGWLW